MDFPTIVPNSDLLRDSLNQFQQFATQSIQGFVDQTNNDAVQPALAAFKSFSDGLIGNVAKTPDAPLTPAAGDTATHATAQAMSNGADPANLAWARANMGRADYIGYCEQFVENASGVNGKYPSALAAAQAQPLQTDWSKVRPGDAVYYGAADENGGFGHAALYAGNGNVVSSAAGHETPLHGYFNAPLLGYVPGADNQHLEPSPVPVEGVPPAPPEQSSDPIANFKDFAGNLMSQLGTGVQDAATNVQTAMGAGDDLQPNPSLTKAPSEQTLGDVANIAATAARPIEDAANLLNPKTIGTAAAGAVTGAEGIEHKELPSIPGLTGAADIASSLTAPGGVLPKAGALEDAAKAAPTLADALRLAADHLEGKVVTPVANAVTDARTALDLLPGEAAASGPGAMPAAPSPIQSAASEVTDKAGGALYETNRLLAPAKNTPPEVQALLRDFADVAAPGMGADVRAESLARKVADALGQDDNVAAAISFEKTGEFVPNPTPEQAAVAAEVRQFTQATGDAGRLAGYISGDVTSGGGSGPSQYLMHLYEDTAQQAAQAGSRGLNPRDIYSFERVHPTLEDAMSAGLTPVDSVSEPVSAYAGKVLDSQAKVKLVDRLKALPNPPVMDMPPAGSRLPEGWVAGGSIAPQFQGVAFDKPVGQTLANILAPSALRGAPVVGGAMTALGVAKENLFSLSGFHLGTELRQAYRAGGPLAGTQAAAKALWSAVNPAAFKDFRLANADVFDRWAAEGVTGLATGGRGPDVGGGAAGLLARAGVSAAEGAALGAGVAKQTGASDQDTLKAALVGGAAGAALGPTVGTQFTKALWERAVPTLKVSTAELLGQRGYDPQAVATFVNQTFGGQNLAAIARSKTVQDATRLLVLAPDWWEGWARQLGSAVLPTDLGQMSRAYWLRTAVLDGAFGLEGMNKALNGHFTNENEPGRQFDLEITGLVGKDQMGNRQYLDVLGPLKQIAQLGATRNPGQFVSSRIGLAPSLALSAVQNQDYAKQPIVPPGTPAAEAAPLYVESALQRLAPIGGQAASQAIMRSTTSPDLPQQTAPGAPLGETVGTILTGMRTSAGPSPAVLYDQRDQGLAKLQSQNQQLYTAFKVAGRPLDPVGSYKGIMLNPAEQLAYQQTRLDTIKGMFKPGEYQKVLALKPVERDAVLSKVLEAADKVAAAKVLTSVGNEQIRKRLTMRYDLGRAGGRAEAMREPPMFTAPATG